MLTSVDVQQHSIETATLSVIMIVWNTVKMFDTVIQHLHCFYLLTVFGHVVEVRRLSLCYLSVIPIK